MSRKQAGSSASEYLAKYDDLEEALEFDPRTKKPSHILTHGEPKSLKDVHES